MTSRPLPVFGKVVQRNENEGSFVIEIDRSHANAPIQTIRACMAQGSFMGDIGGDAIKPRFVPNRPKGLIKDGKEVVVNLYLPAIDQRVFAVVVDSGSGLTMVKWAFENWFYTTQGLIDERIKREARQRLEQEIVAANAMLDAIDDELFGNPEIPVAVAFGSDTVHVTADEGIQESTIGAVVASKGTPFKAPRKGGKNGAESAQHQPQA